MKKYELTEETTTYLGKTLHRIKYLIDIRNYNIKTGDLGGYIEQETNLSQDSDCCVKDNGMVMDKGMIIDNGYVAGNATVMDFGYVADNGVVTDNGCVTGCACVTGNGLIRSWKDVVTISGFFGKRENITFYRTQDDNIGVTCGKHTWNLEEFRKMASQMYKDIDIIKEYLDMADLVEKRFKRLEGSKGHDLNKLSFFLPVVNM